jgi:hypothetical protein
MNLELPFDILNDLCRASALLSYMIEILAKLQTLGESSLLLDLINKLLR